MGRLISEQAVIESIEFYQMNPQHFDFVNLIDDIKDIPSAEQRWIPVSERLPEKNGEYLITGRRGAVNKRRYHDGHWYSNWSVLAWMPLPESYKAESEV